MLAIFGLGIAVGHAARPGTVGQQPGTVGPSGYGPRRLGTAVYPAQEIPLHFDHGRHLELSRVVDGVRQQMACRDCHREIEHSRSASENNFPTGVVCDECHGPQHPKARGEAARCDMCHTRTSDEGKRVTKTLVAPRPRLSFNHELHLKRGATCDRCHSDMSKVRLATTMQLPTETTCLECHDGKQATDRCSACHPANATGRLITRQRDDITAPPLLPRGRSSWGAEHDLAFVENHAGVAKADPELCRSCHDDDFCQSCHNGAIRPMRIHAANYFTSHALDARANTQDCSSCHRRQSDCRACHQRLGVTRSQDGAFGVGSGLSFHPDGWAGPPGSPQGHSFAAQRNLQACVSCHGEDTCLSCHATTAVGRPGLDVSPHGPGFEDSVRCQVLSNRNRRVCLKCHAPGDGRLECD
jgi:hypothetical protein